MRGLAVLLLGVLATLTFGGCCGGCPKSGYAPCTWTYEVDRVCTRTCTDAPRAPMVVRSAP